MESKIKDLSIEERYYFWLMVSLGFKDELGNYLAGCFDSDEEVSSLVFDLYNTIRDKNELQRTLYLSFVNAKSINKDDVKNRIIDFFYDQLVNNKMLPSDIAACLGAFYRKETEWYEFDLLSENFELVSEGISRYDPAREALTEYLMKNHTSKAESDPEVKDE